MTTSPKDYEIQKGVLRVHRQALHDRDLLFDEACSELLDAPERNLVIDLSVSTYINSTYIGILAATFFQADARRKKLRLRASPEIAQALRLAGFEKFVPIEEVA
ncbi:MAG: STAS domain-containing protein [Planctomycetota bacterium]